MNYYFNTKDTDIEKSKFFNETKCRSGISHILLFYLKTGIIILNQKWIFSEYFWVQKQKNIISITYHPYFCYFWSPHI